MIPANTRKKLLKKLPDQLLDQSRFVPLRKGECLFQPGDGVESIYYVISGQLRALRYQLDGKPAVMMHSCEDNFFAPVSINMETYPCAAMASKATTLLKIPKGFLIDLFHSDPAFSLKFIGSISMDLKNQCSNAERLRIKSARGRILHFITCESPDSRTLELKCTLTTWAEELGIEPESLYRTLAEMEKEGIIARENKRIEIINPL
ncbi:MAG: Crp/Fnr family transcriptional regulator [bacterium]